MYSLIFCYSWTTTICFAIMIFQKRSNLKKNGLVDKGSQSSCCVIQLTRSIEPSQVNFPHAASTSLQQRNSKDPIKNSSSQLPHLHHDSTVTHFSYRSSSTDGDIHLDFYDLPRHLRSRERAKGSFIYGKNWLQMTPTASSELPPDCS